MSYRTILELTDRISAESSPEQKIALLEELRRLLNDEKEMLHANLETFFPCAWLSGQFMASPSQGDAPLVADAHVLRQRAEALRTRAINFIQEADALALRADHLEKSAPVKGGAKPSQATAQAAKAA